MVPLAFQGGTALRFLHAIPRYSEDLDFALEREAGAYDLRGYAARIALDLGREDYTVECKVSDHRVVHAAMVRFPGLLHELGLSGRKQEILAVRIDVDTRPPEGARMETTVVRRHELLQLQHHDKGSLLAGKLHAVMRRPYTKGRDLFDLAWYLSDPTWPEPNLKFLGAALRQSGHAAPPPTRTSWKALIRERIATLDLRRAADDVRPFLEPGIGDAILTEENFRRLLAT
jgi:predicted nucleotidyltransferase component of viral defense system